MLIVYCAPSTQVNADSNPITIENLALLSGENLLDTLIDNGLILPEALEKDKEYT